MIVNTGDDFEHLGLAISPDVDTTLYTLAGVANPETGWGRRDETWSFMEAIAELGGPTWFRLGDRDLATHVERTRRLRAGETPTAVTAHLAARLGVAARVLPMTDDPVRTVVETDAGTLAFQDYFVREQCRPVVRSLRYEGAGAARMTAAGARPRCRRRRWGASSSAPPIRGSASIRSLPFPACAQAIRASGAPVIAVSAHHRRQGGEGADGEDHGRAGLGRPTCEASPGTTGTSSMPSWSMPRTARRPRALPPAHLRYRHADADPGRQDRLGAALPGALRAPCGRTRGRLPRGQHRAEPAG